MCNWNILTLKGWIFLFSSQDFLSRDPFPAPVSGSDQTGAGQVWRVVMADQCIITEHLDKTNSNYNPLPSCLATPGPHGHGPHSPGVRGQLAWSAHPMVGRPGLPILIKMPSPGVRASSVTECARVFLSRLSFYPDHNQFIPSSCLILISELTGWMPLNIADTWAGARAPVNRSHRGIVRDHLHQLQLAG